MVLFGETIKERHTICVDCQKELDIGVQRSNAGYYIGFVCPNCGPYSRESRYYDSYEEAEIALKNGLFGRF